MPKIVTDLDIQALVDDELELDDEMFVREYIRDNDWAQERYQQLIGQKQVLIRLFDNQKYN